MRVYIYVFIIQKKGTYTTTVCPRARARVCVLRVTADE